MYSNMSPTIRGMMPRNSELSRTPYMQGGKREGGEEAEGEGGRGRRGGERERERGSKREGGWSSREEG